MWCAFPAAADPIAIEAHCMGFSVPASSSLRKDPEEALTIRACRLFGLVRSRRGCRRGLFRWHLLALEGRDSRQA